MNGKILLLALAFILVCCGKSTADTLTADELKLKDAMLRYSEAEIARRKQAIESLREHTANPGREIKQHQDAINRYTKQAFQLPRLDIRQVKVGDIGQFVVGHRQVDRSYRMTVVVSDSAKPITCKVIQVIDERNMIVQWPTEISSTAASREKSWFWVTGLHTTATTDDQSLTLPHVFEVTGTKQYGTVAGGTKTVLEFKVFSIQDTDPLIKKIDAYESAGKKTPSKMDAGRELRTWTDASGSFTVEATFGGIMAGKVLLVKEDGSKLHVTREQLSSADNAYLDEITKR